MSFSGLPLRRLIPLSLVLFIVPPLSGLSYWHYLVEKEATQQRYIRQAEVAMSSLHHLIEYGLAEREEVMVQKAMVSVEGFPCFSRAIGLTDGQRVMLASDRHWVGRPLQEVDPRLAEVWPRLDRSMVRLEHEGDRVAAYRQLRPMHEFGGGWLYLELDLSDELEKQFQVAVEQTAMAVIVVLIFSLLLWRWIAHSVTKPLTHLSQAARKIALGHAQVIVKQQGSRELVELARSFNTMQRELSQRHAALLRQRTLYQALSDTNQSIVRADDEQMLLANVCEVAVRAGIKLVWVGYVDKRTAKLRVVHTAGEDVGWLDTVRRHIGLDHDPLAEAITQGYEKRLVFAEQPGCNPYWLSEARLNGFNAGAALPIQRSGSQVGGLAVLSDDVGLVDDDSMRLLREMASDLSYALDALDKESIRHRVEQSLASDRALLRTLIDTIPDLIFFKDRVQIYLGCNKAFESLLAIPESELVGSTDRDILPEVQAQAFHTQDSKILQTGAPERSEEWMEYPDGRRVLLDIVKTPYRGPNDQIMGLIGVGRDITEEYRTRKKLYQTLQVLENAERIANLGSWAYDPQTDRMHWSGALYQILGLDPTRIQPNFERFLEQCHPDDRERMQRNKEALLEGELPAFEYQHRVVTADGELRYVVGRGRVSIESGQSYQLMGTLQDITPQIEMAQERERALDAMRQSRKLEVIGELTGGVAHSLNNILVPIISYADLAGQSQTLSRENLQDYLDRISEAAVRGKELIARLMTVSHGGSSQKAAAQDLAPLVEETVKLLHSTFPPGITIATRFQSDVPKVVIDPTHLNQILMNLCLNARDELGDQGEITIDLRFSSGVDLICTACGAQVVGDRVELTVSDDGPGVAPENRSKLFDPFFSTKQPEEIGAGMGLAVVQGLLQSYQGHVALSSVPGNGACFRLFFQAAPEHAPSIIDDGGDNHASEKAVCRERVLLVDDEPLSTLFLKDVLETQGLSVEVFSDSETALERFLQSPARFDLLLTDQGMPKLTGLELIQRAKAVEPQLPTILCTGGSEIVNAGNARALGVDYYLEKPVIADELLKVLNLCLGDKRYEC